MKDKDIEKLFDGVARVAKECEQSMPDSGQFAASRELQPLVEQNAAIEAFKWLQVHRGLVGYLKISQPDPPDVVFHLSDGTRFSIEFTTVTHEKTMQVIKHNRDQHGIQDGYQNWTPKLFQERIRELLEKKETQFRKHLATETASRPLALLLGFDGKISGDWLIDGFSVTSEIFDEVLVHLGYIPNANPTENNNSEYLIVDILEQS